MSRHPSVYGKMLRDLMATHNVTCWLVNTGWTGGKYGIGRRMSLPDTRALVNLALAGKLDSVPMERDPIFGLAVPTALSCGRDTWSEKGDYDAQARRLVSMFEENFKKFQAYVEPDVTMTAPALRAAE
jgi:phosphoenolpyruvate carboxykinase (ATP)